METVMTRMARSALSFRFALSMNRRSHELTPAAVDVAGNPSQFCET
jgi:hypothetical protein